MRIRRVSRLRLSAWGGVLLSVVAMLASGCTVLSPLLSAQPTESPASFAPPPATPAPQFAPTLAHNPEIVDDADLLRFLAELEARGVSPLSVDDSQNPILRPAPGLAYRLDNGHLHIHVYPSAAEAHQRAQQVPAELAQSIADWVGTPHFFECGRLLAMYFGDDAAELAALGEICGAELPIVTSAAPAPVWPATAKWRG